MKYIIQYSLRHSIHRINSNSLFSFEFQSARYNQNCRSLRRNPRYLFLYKKSRHELVSLRGTEKDFFHKIASKHPCFASFRFLRIRITKSGTLIDRVEARFYRCIHGCPQALDEDNEDARARRFLEPPPFLFLCLSLSLPPPAFPLSQSKPASFYTLREKLRLDSSKPPINSANRLDHLLAHGRIRRRARDAHWKRERRDASISRRKISSSPPWPIYWLGFSFFFFIFRVDADQVVHGFLFIPFL